MKKGKVLMGIFGFLIVGLGCAIHVNAAETDFATCIEQDECILESDVTIDSSIDLKNDLILDLNGYTITSNVKTPNALSMKCRANVRCAVQKFSRKNRKKERNFTDAKKIRIVRFCLGTRRLRSTVRSAVKPF